MKERSGGRGRAGIKGGGSTGKPVADTRSGFIERGIEAFFLARPALLDHGLLVAYSGGADSSALLDALCGCAGRASAGNSALRFRGPFRVVHVVHSLRPAAELAAERTLVEGTCARLGAPLTVATVKPGAIEALARRRGIGIEAAARLVRYGILARIARRFGIGTICTAHNADDQLETLIARFLASSSADGLEGIRPTREMRGGLILARPLIFAPRKEIERYAAAKGILFSTDSTNASGDYARNRIRREVVPALDRAVPGWRTGLLGTSRKLSEDKSALGAELAKALAACSVDRRAGRASIGLPEFLALPKAIRVRLLTRLVAAVNAREGGGGGAGFEAARAPRGGISLSYRAVADAADSIASGAPGADLLGARLETRDGRLEITPVLDFRREDRYFFQIPSEGSYRCGPLSVELRWRRPGEAKAPEKGFLLEGAFTFPLILRTRKPGDSIAAPEGERRLDDLLKSWRLDARLRGIVPVIEDRRGIVAILPASLSGKGCAFGKFREYAGPVDGRRLYIRIKGA